MENYFVLKHSTFKKIMRELKNTCAQAKQLDTLPSPYRGLMLHYENHAGRPELHHFEDDIYIVLSGRANLTIGGTMINSVDLNENDVLGDRITGGNTISIKTGDVILISKETPHHLEVKQSTISYLLIKVNHQ